VQGFNVQIKILLNQRSLSCESNKKDKHRKTKQNKRSYEQLSPEIVIKIREIRPKR